MRMDEGNKIVCKWIAYKPQAKNYYENLSSVLKKIKPVLFTGLLFRDDKSATN